MDGDAHRATSAHLQAAGTHWLVDCHGVAEALLADVDGLRTMLRAAAERAGATILFDHFHDFGHASSAGVTGVVLLAESHATIHTWPKAGFAAVDLFLCGATDGRRAVAVIEAALKPARIDLRPVDRAA